MDSTSKFCENCGVALEQGVSFCESCGSAVVPVEVSSSEKLFPCPKCGKIDKIIKAEDAKKRLGSVPEKENLSDEEFKESLEREEWIEALSVPPIPQKFSILYWFFCPFVPVAGIIVMLFSPLEQGGKAFMRGFILTFVIVVILYASGVPGKYYDNPLDAQGLIGLLGCAMILIYWGCLFYTKFVENNKLASKVSEFNQRISRYNHIRFCERCKIMYDDGDPNKKYSSLDEVASFFGARSKTEIKEVSSLGWGGLGVAVAIGLLLLSIKFVDPARKMGP